MIFVTGASGFIGRYVVRELLNRGNIVCCLVRDCNRYDCIGDEECIEGDLSDIQSFKKKLYGRKIDALIHLAWQGIPDYSFEISQKNLQYGLNILRLCKELQINKLVITGSCWEYDHPTGAIRTDHALSFEKPFPAAKNALHMMAYAFCKENNIKLNWLRLFYVYGPGQRKESLIPHIIRSIQDGRQPELNGAFNENDFVFVEDVARAIVEVSLGSFPETMNVGSGKATRVLDIVDRLSDIMEFEIDKTLYDESNRSIFFAKNDETLFPITPITSMSEGLNKVVANL